MHNKKSTSTSLSNNKSAVLISRINYLYKERYFRGIKNLIQNTSIPTLVEVLEKIGDFEIINIFLIASQNINLGQFFLSFNIDNQIEIIKKIRPIILEKLLEDLNADDVVELLTYLDSHLYKKVILAAKPGLRNEIKKIKHFEHGQAGSIMNTTIFTIKEDIKVSDAVTILRKKRNEFDIEQEIFIVNEDKNVVGTVQIQDLFFCDRQMDLISEIMDKSFVTVAASEEIDQVIDLFQKYNLNILAVIGENKQILGIITNNDIIPEIIEENWDDVHKLYGISSTSESYIRSDVFEIVKSRIVWLLILLFATTFTTLIIDKFEVLGYQWTAGISSAILVPIIPVITDMSGNSGSQTTATIIQAFACNEIKKEDFWRVVSKEMRVAIIIGGILAIFNFGRLLIYFSIFPFSHEKINIKQTTTMITTVADFVQTHMPNMTSAKTITVKHGYLLGVIGALTSSISLFLVVVISKLLGVLIPFLAIKLDYNPAAFSTPVLTTILDTVSAIIFFGLGIIILNAAIQPIIDATVVNGSLTFKTSSSSS